MPTKQKDKPRVPWETLAVRKMRTDVKITSLRNRWNPTNINTQKLKKAQNELTNVNLKEQIEYIQNQKNKLESRLKIDNGGSHGRR